MSVAEVLARPDRQEWLDWRRRGIGGSDAAVVVGLSPFKTPLELFLEKRGLIPDAEPSEAMRWGSLLEEVVIREFEARSGLFVTDEQKLCSHPQFPWMLSTVDGFVCETRSGSGLLGLYEGKTAGHYSPGWTDDGQVPEHVVIQVQHNLAVTGLERAWIACLHAGQRLAVYEIASDPELQDALIGEELAFWEGVANDIPPPADGSDDTSKALRIAFAESDSGRGVELPEHAPELVEIFRQAQQDEAAAAKRAAQARNQLELLLGTAEVGTFEGLELVTWRGYTRSSVDLDALREAHPDLVKQFTRAVPARRFGVKKEGA